jgi:rhodanese-related sulfurtransferase
MMLVNPADLVAQAKATIQECSVRDVHDCIGADTLFIDIREPAEYQRGHIPGAVHLPRGMLEFEMHNVVARCHKDANLPPEEQPIVLYCGTGGRSAFAALTAEALGYKNVKSMSGGIVAWAEARLPIDFPQG